MSKRTSGKWIADGREVDQGPTVGEGCTIAIALSSNESQDSDGNEIEVAEATANATLIAASGDLLDAAKLALENLRYKADHTRKKWTVKDQETFDVLKAAIAKAESM